MFVSDLSLSCSIACADDEGRHWIRPSVELFMLMLNMVAED